jgi:FtsP/CotA-like multicopper oxidase with cupredoxin domain
MDHHPMHMHGHRFVVTGTEGGRVPETPQVHEADAHSLARSWAP